MDLGQEDRRLGESRRPGPQSLPQTQGSRPPAPPPSDPGVWNPRSQTHPIAPPSTQVRPLQAPLTPGLRSSLLNFLFPLIQVVIPAPPTPQIPSDTPAPSPLLLQDSGSPDSSPGPRSPSLWVPSPPETREPKPLPLRPWGPRRRTSVLPLPQDFCQPGEWDLTFLGLPHLFWPPGVPATPQRRPRRPVPTSGSLPWPQPRICFRL